MAEGETFGNNRILTSKAWRPSYVLAVGEITQVLLIPVSLLEKALKHIANSGPNLIKTQFFR